MPDVDPYVDDPGERPPAPRLRRLVPLLAISVLLLLVLARIAMTVVSDRQDPTLEIPRVIETDVPAVPLPVPS